MIRQWRKGLVALMAAAAVAGMAQGAAAEKVTLAFPIGITGQYSDFTYGIELGFFAEEGIELEMVSLQGSAVLVPQLINGSVDFGLGNPDVPLLPLAKGEPIPVRFVYNYLRRSVYEYSVKADSAVKTVADLKGKTLGIGALTWGNIPMTKSILKESGVTWQKDIEVVPVGTGPAAWKQLETGKVDVLAFFTSEHEKMRAAGLDIRLLDYPEKYQHLFSSGMMASVNTIEKRPELVAKMGRAMAKMTVACAANRDACARSFWKTFPASKPAPDQEATWIANTKKLLEGNYRSLSFFPDGKPRWGYFRPESWKVHMQVLHEGGVIPTAELDLDKLYTNRFVDEFNKFDTEAVVAKAKASGK